MSEKKKETRGRKYTMHKPLSGSFNSVLGAIARSSKATRTIRKKKK